MTKIPTIGALDERDPEDAKIIQLFDTPGTGEEHAADQSNDKVASPNTHAFSDRRDDISAPDAMPEPTPPPIMPSPVSEPTGRPERETKKRLWWHVASILVVLMAILGVVLVFTRSIFSRQTDTCSANASGVTLYTDITYQGQCHTFGPGNYELALSGLEQKVSSIKDPNNAYHIKLFDKEKNFYYIDTSMPILTAEWDNRADTIHVEKHRPTSCSPGANGIIAFINPDYSGGCLFITDNIPDLAPLNFDSVIVSIQFVGGYQNTRQLVLYKQPNYKEKCGAYWQNQSDPLQCARIALNQRFLLSTMENNN